MDAIRREFLSIARDFKVISRGILDLKPHEISLFDPPGTVEEAKVKVESLRKLLPKLRLRCVRFTRSNICFSSIERALDAVASAIEGEEEEATDPMCEYILDTKKEMARVAVSFCNAKQSEAKLLQSRVLFESIERQATFRRIARTITRLFKKELSKKAQRELCDRTQTGVAILGDLTFLLSLAQDQP